MLKLALTSSAPKDVLTDTWAPLISLQISAAVFFFRILALALTFLEVFAANVEKRVQLFVAKGSVRVIYKFSS